MLFLVRIVNGCLPARPIPRRTSYSSFPVVSAVVISVSLLGVARVRESRAVRYYEAHIVGAVR